MGRDKLAAVSFQKKNQKMYETWKSKYLESIIVFTFWIYPLVKANSKSTMLQQMDRQSLFKRLK